jgi:hypothetical protein
MPGGKSMHTSVPPPPRFMIFCARDVGHLTSRAGRPTRGGAGDDTLLARDAAADVLDGWDGNDWAQVDRVDHLTGVEATLP